MLCVHGAGGGRRAARQGGRGVGRGAAGSCRVQTQNTPLVAVGRLLEREHVAGVERAAAGGVAPQALLDRRLAGGCGGGCSGDGNGVCAMRQASRTGVEQHAAGQRGVQRAAGPLRPVKDLNTAGCTPLRCGSQEQGAQDDPQPRLAPGRHGGRCLVVAGCGKSCLLSIGAGAAAQAGLWECTGSGIRPG